MNPVAKMLITGGIVLLVIGLLWQFGGRFLHLGRLPGDISVEKKEMSGFIFRLSPALSFLSFFL